MKNNRDNFTPKTKLALAQRVGYRCSCPNCSNKTIGPHLSNPELSQSLGEAAHIHAAAPRGPRYLKTMTSEERSSIANGIWLCKFHARMVDLDDSTYTAEKLQSWKSLAEEKAAQEMLALQHELQVHADTLICLDIDLMFTGIWMSVNEDKWTFTVKDFLFGNIERLRGYGKNELLPMRRYIIIESQNEGRLLKEGFQWQINEQGVYEIMIQVYPPAKKIRLEALGGDIALTYDGDLLINDDFKIVKDVELAKQLIERNLGLPIGGWKLNQLMGSFFSMYYHQYADNPSLLNRLIRIELLRLANIPIYQTEHDMNTPLNFIAKIIEVSVMPQFNDLVPVFLSLEWSDHTFWSDTIYVPLYTPDQENEEWEPPEFVQKLFEQPPLELLKKMSNIFKGPALKIARHDEIILGLFNKTLPAIFNAAKAGLDKDIYPLFNSYEQKQSIDGRIEFWTSYDLELAVQKRTVQQIGNHLYMKGFKNAGIDAFDINADLNIYFEDYHYAIGGGETESMA